MLQSVAWAIRSTVNVAIQRSPGKLAFGQDMILPLKVNFLKDNPNIDMCMIFVINVDMTRAIRESLLDNSNS